MPARRPILLTGEAAGAAAVEQASQYAEVVVAGSDRVDLPTALAALSERGHQVVLCEGGATLLGELVGGRLLDELCLTISPMMGGDPLPVARRSSPAAALAGFRLAHVGGDDRGALFLRYRTRSRRRS